MKVSVRTSNGTIGSSSKQIIWLETKQQAQIYACEKQQFEERAREMKMKKKGEWMGRKKENQKITKFTTDIRFGGVLFLLRVLFFFPVSIVHMLPVLRDGVSKQHGIALSVWPSGTLKAENA